MPEVTPTPIAGFPEPGTLLTDVDGLFLAARQTASGTLTGLHRSTRRGSSIEFSEHKLYTPGDDVKHIDWRAFAKTDKIHVKQFEDETNLRIELLIDHSGSMGFKGEQPLSKLEYAKVLTASLAYLALRQSDATGLATFATQISQQLPPRSRSSHLMEIIDRLAALQAEGETDLSATLEQFVRSRRRPTFTIVVTDLLDPSETLMPMLRALASKKHEVTVLHILAPEEIEFPYENPAVFSSMEDSRKLFVHPRTLRQRYVKAMEEHLSIRKKEMQSAQIDYRLIRTDEPPRQALEDFIKRRMGK
jgi:uncharacterized protein (DUF58 family)